MGDQFADWVGRSHGRNLAIFDATRNHVCFQALNGVRMELAKCFLGVSCCEWPPPVLPDQMIIEDDGPEDETSTLKLCRSLMCSVRGGMSKAASLDATLQTAVKNLETEAVKLQNHVVVRQSIWRETKAMETLLCAVWDTSEDGALRHACRLGALSRRLLREVAGGHCLPTARGGLPRIVVLAELFRCPL